MYLTIKKIFKLSCIYCLSFLLQTTNLFSQAKSEINWLNNNLIPLQFDGTLSNPKVLKPYLSEAEIVGLGEFTHGTQEVFQVKVDLVKYMIEELGYRMFIIEDDFSASIVINNYINGEELDSLFVRRILMRLWDTEPYWEMISWMRAFNKTNEEKIQYFGCDMQQPWADLKRIENFYKQKEASPGIVFIDSIRKILGKRKKSLSKVEKVKIERWSKELMKSTKRLEPDPLTSLSMTTLNQYAKSLQKNTTSSAKYRERCMAENILSLNELKNNDKLIFWAHNSHISDRSYFTYVATGHELKNKFKEKYKTLAFASSQGTYFAYNDSLGYNPNNRLTPPSPGSFESFFAKSNSKAFFLNLELGDKKDEVSSWICQQHDFRSIGWKATGRQFVRYVLKDAFDFLIYIHETSASSPVFRNSKLTTQ